MTHTADTPREANGSWLFAHITKCGGTSILEAIREAYPESSRLELNGDHYSEKSRILADVGGRLPSAAIVFGHRVFSGLVPFMQPPVQMVTVLRNPIDRAISHYNYILTRPPERQVVHRALTANNVRVPFAAWLNDFPPASNHLVWMLCQVLGDEHRVFDFSRRVGHAEYQLVSERLQSFSQIFFVETAGVDAATRILTGLPPRVANVGSGRFVDPADQEARKNAAQACGHDLAIYDQALQHFERSPKKATMQSAQREKLNRDPATPQSIPSGNAEANARNRKR